MVRIQPVNHREALTRRVIGARLKEAFESAVMAVANAIPIPGISRNEVAQVAAQYISGLVEDGKVTETFETWLKRVPHGRKPPSADTLLIPDPDNLGNVTRNDLDKEATAQGIEVMPAVLPGILLDPSASIDEVDQAIIDNAIDSASQAQEIQETGTCSGCFDSDRNGNSDDDSGDDHFGGE
jgi:hypothetical protein